MRSSAFPVTPKKPLPLPSWHMRLCKGGLECPKRYRRGISGSTRKHNASAALTYLHLIRAEI